MRVSPGAATLKFASATAASSNLEAFMDSSKREVITAAMRRMPSTASPLFGSAAAAER